MTRPPSAPVELNGVDGSPGLAALRAAFTLSAAIRQPFTIAWADDLPGLGPAGVLAGRVSMAVFGGSLTGGGDGSRQLTYRPETIRSGTINIEAAGTPLAPLLEMILPACALSGAVGQLRATGLTHQYGEPSFHDLVYGWLPLAEMLGLNAEIVLGGAGFAPDGNGIVEARFFPAPRLKGLELTSRGLLVETQALALVANLGIGIALPLERRLSERLRASGIVAQVEALPMPADRSRGVAAVVLAQFERVRVAVSVTGEIGRPPEEVADRAVEGLQQLLRRRGAIPADVAPRLLVPLALAASPYGAPGAIGREGPAASRVSTTEVTPALIAVADVIRRMLPVDIQIQGLPGTEGIVEVKPRAT